MAHLSTKQLTQALKLRKLIDQLEARVDAAKSRLQGVLAGGKVTAKRKPGRKAGKKAGRRKGKVGRPKATRAPRKGSQKELVHQVLADAGKPLTADQILAGAKAKGYKSKSKDEKKTLGVMLYTDKAIKRAGRGLFKLIGKAAPKAKRGARKK
jgi:hypothetical protein